MPLLPLLPWARIATALIVATCATSAIDAVGAQTEKPKENLEDDPQLAIQERLQRLDKRLDHLEGNGEELGYLYSAMEQSIAAGRAIAAELDAKEAELGQGAATTTVRTALGDGEARGLAWHCSRAREIAPQLARVATAAVAAIDEHRAGMGGVKVGSEGADSALRAHYSRLQAALASGPLDPAERARLVTDLAEIEVGLPHAWGSYTTMRQMAGEPAKSSSPLLQWSLVLRDGAQQLEPLINDFLAERKAIGDTLDLLQPEFAADVAQRDSLRKRWKESELPALKDKPLAIVETGHTLANQWFDKAEAMESVWKRTDADKTMASFATAVRACGSWEQPPRDFTDARAAAGGPLNDRFVRLDEAYVARAQQIQQALNTATEVRINSQATVDELDHKMAEAKRRGRVDSSLLETAKQLRADAAAEVTRMERAETLLGSEAQVVNEQRAGIAATRTTMMGLFNTAAE